MRKVGIDTLALKHPEGSGYSYYVSGLYTALTRVAPNDVEIVGLQAEGSGNLSTPKRFWHDRVTLPQLAKVASVDVLHQPIFSCPPFDKPVVWTLHDLRQLARNEAMSATAALYWKKWLPWSARYASKIVCISDNTYQDALRYLPIPKERYSVIPVGVPDAVLSWQLSSQEKQAIRAKFNVTKPYFCTVGTIQPIKNIPFLIEVFAAWRKEFALTHQLVLIGKKGWDYPQVVSALAAHKLEEGKDVIITDYVTDDEKWALMQDAEAFVFPSLYEGFGIPPLEAQALGVPIISSNTSSLPGVIGDGGVLADPTSVREWLAAYETFNKTRTDLVAAGKKNVTRFHWDTIAKQWIAVYKSL